MVALHRLGENLHRLISKKSHFAVHLSLGKDEVLEVSDCLTAMIPKIPHHDIPFNIVTTHCDGESLKRLLDMRFGQATAQEEFYGIPRESLHLLGAPFSDAVLMREHGFEEFQSQPYSFCVLAKKPKDKTKDITFTISCARQQGLGLIKLFTLTTKA